ncbi:MAG: sigma 54-interacting transcriptional regulator, partial [Myxococcota bacterium]
MATAENFPPLTRGAPLREERQLRPLTVDALVGDAPVMRRVRHLIQQIARSPASTVLITGESGTGKDLAAKVLHAVSHRATRPFMTITCSALPESLLENELFGHERGAYTDAKEQRLGLLELAHGGTVFLDEVGELAPPLQAKLLRFLEERTFKRVGGTTDIHVDVRVIAATHRNLDDAVTSGVLREDLYYRLRVLPIVLPALRDHLEDLPLLTAHFVEHYNAELGKSVRGLASSALRAMQDYRWPGNIRELRNAIERAMLLGTGPMLGETDVVIDAAPATRELFLLPREGVNLMRLERDLVRQALERCHGNRTRAAVLLGLNRDQVRYRARKLGLSDR